MTHTNLTQATVCNLHFHDKHTPTPEPSCVSHRPVEPWEGFHCSPLSSPYPPPILALSVPYPPPLPFLPIPSPFPTIPRSQHEPFISLSFPSIPRFFPVPSPVLLIPSHFIIISFPVLPLSCTCPSLFRPLSLPFSSHKCKFEPSCLLHPKCVSPLLNIAVGGLPLLMIAVDTALVGCWRLAPC